MAHTLLRVIPYCIDKSLDVIVVPVSLEYLVHDTVYPTEFLDRRQLELHVIDFTKRLTTKLEFHPPPNRSSRDPPNSALRFSSTFFSSTGALPFGCALLVPVQMMQ